MNKKEVAEIRRNMEIDNDLLTVNRVVISFIDSQKDIKCQSDRGYTEIPREDLECIFDSMKRGISGSLGKALVEYEFPKESYEEGHSQNILYKALQSRLENEDDVNNLIDHIIKNLDYESTYTIMIAHCTYTVFRKNKAGDEDPYDSLDYSFLAVMFCPVAVRVDGLIYNEEENAITRKTNYDKVVAEKPDNSFLYPTFTGRGPDVNHVLVFNRNVKKPDVSLVENVLECEFSNTVNDQKAAFHDILEDAAGDDLDYNLISTVNEKIRDIVENTKDEYDIAEINEADVCNILIDSGIDESKEETIRNSYKERLGDATLPAVNLLENKMQIKTDGITITVGEKAVDKVRTREENGRHFLLIDLDDPSVEINGMPSKIK